MKQGFWNKQSKNEVTSNKHKKVTTTLNYVEHFLILASEVTECISTSTYDYFLGISIGIASSSI